MIYAVISNPKAAKFKTLREPLHRLSHSTHIRFVVISEKGCMLKEDERFRVVIFHKWPIVGVDVSINAQLLGSATQSNDNRNLYVLPWNASQYNDGRLHRISVEIVVS